MKIRIRVDIMVWPEGNIVKGAGIRIIISISKMMKIRAIRKNWREKGIRVLYKGLKPHSNGDAFSVE